MFNFIIIIYNAFDKEIHFLYSIIRLKEKSKRFTLIFHPFGFFVNPFDKEIQKDDNNNRLKGREEYEYFGIPSKIWRNGTIGGCLSKHH